MQTWRATWGNTYPPPRTGSSTWPSDANPPPPWRMHRRYFASISVMKPSVHLKSLENNPKLFPSFSVFSTIGFSLLMSLSLQYSYFFNFFFFTRYSFWWFIFTDAVCAPHSLMNIFIRSAREQPLTSAAAFSITEPVRSQGFAGTKTLIVTARHKNTFQTF